MGSITSPISYTTASFLLSQKHKIEDGYGRIIKSIDLEKETYSSEFEGNSFSNGTDESEGFFLIHEEIPSITALKTQIEYHQFIGNEEVNISRNEVLIYLYKTAKDALK